MLAESAPLAENVKELGVVKCGFKAVANKVRVQAFRGEVTDYGNAPLGQNLRQCAWQISTLVIHGEVIGEL